MQDLISRVLHFKHNDFKQENRLGALYVLIY